MKTLIWTSLFIALTATASVAQPPGTEPGWYSGVDLLFLSPKISEQGVNNIFFYGNLPPSAEFGGSIDAPLDFAQRVYVGFQGDQGGGIRTRWFTFDNDLDYAGQWQNGGPLINLIGNVKLDVDAVDLEFTQTGNFQVWNWMASAGARYGRVDLREDAINFEDVPASVFVGQSGVNFEGAGPTFSVQGARPVLFDGFSLYANLRTSLLFGDTDLASPFRNQIFNVSNEFVQVWEIQAGIRQFVTLTDNVDLVGGIFWEAQRWDSDSNFLGDLAFHGFGVQTGLIF